MLNRAILFTGASGFLGKNILPILSEKFSVKTVGITETDDFRCDLSKEIPNFTNSFDIVLHAAGKAHVVPKTEAEKKIFFDINYQGTINLCKALEKVGIPKAIIFISTVAVYGCETGVNITEEHPLNGNTPYALSKIQAEKFLQNWCCERGVQLSILRPSLLAGPNPPGNLGAMINGINDGRYLSIAGGKAKKSVLMVYDIANLIPVLIEKGGIYNVCDSNHPSFRELEITISKQLGKKLPKTIPYWLASVFAFIGDFLGKKAPINTLKLSKITEPLTFSNEKAMKELNWMPMDVITNFKIK